MKKVRVLLLIAITASVAGLIVAGCATTGSGTAPVPGGSGVITISGIDATSLTLTWTKATDDATAPENLEYRAYYATVSSITTPEDVEANATAVGDWEKDIATKDVTGLAEVTDYYFAVLVRDEDGNMAAYKVAKQTTYMSVSVTFNNFPAAAKSIELDITGPEMDDINLNLPADALTISVGAPPGSSRVFSAVVRTASVTSIGEGSIDLVPGESAQLIIDLTINETKIIIPDAENHRIVQVDDMTGTGWTTLTWENLGFSTKNDFDPYDIDFDAQGRIYIANYPYGGETDKGVLRIDDINDTEYDTIVSPAVITLAIDRVNNWVYYANNDEIYRCDYNGGNVKQYTYYGGFTGNIKGLAVDQAGMVYLVWNPGSDGDSIAKFDPDTVGTPIVDDFIDNWGVSISDAWDILVKSSSVYVVNTSGDNGYRILQFDTNLSKLTGNYGNTDDGNPPNNPGEFYGPRRFVAILNKKLTVTDEVEYAYKDRLVSLDDTLDGSGWETYGANGSGTGQFSFFVMY